ncbi:MAG: thymidine kinase [Candidatus Bipolaricaulota bacterium]|nr:thymidine kinase [Candidatus Bipolaricaulota bacterium]MDW8152486.1 thymidine kinase [Candidatus Bipolaricaulota bacterium]
MMGRLEVITGPMFAGKTEELLRRVERARIARKSVLLFKPEIDVRYSATEVVTHNGRRLPCRLLPVAVDLGSFQARLDSETLRATEVFAFDEAHFFGPAFPELCEHLVAQGKRVIVAGLDLNFRAEPFGPMPALLALADEVLKLTAVCTVCGAPATRTQRLLEGKPVLAGPEVLIGGLEAYEPRCRAHFLPPR